jgi:hypothetical protein
MWIAVFYIVMPRSILGGYQCFGGTCHLSLRGRSERILKTEVVCSSVMMAASC